jgi:DNA-binding response OmpR family regulator
MTVLAMSSAAERHAHAAVLSESGFVVVEASDPSDASNLVGRLLPEIVVVDVGWGLELPRLLRTGPLSEHVGIVGLGRGLDPEKERDALAAGFDIVLEAPCQPETLLTELLVMLAAINADSDSRLAAAQAIETKTRGG